MSAETELNPPEDLIAAYKIERLRKNAIGKQQFCSTATLNEFKDHKNLHTQKFRCLFHISDRVVRFIFSFC